MDDLPDYEDDVVDAEIPVAGQRKFNWGAVGYVSGDEDQCGEETVNEARNNGVTYAECIQNAHAGRRASRKPALPVEPDDYDADTEKSDPAEDATTGTGMDDLPDYKSTMNHEAMNSNIKREESAEENQNGRLDHESGVENVNSQANGSMRSNAAPMTFGSSQFPLALISTLPNVTIKTGEFGKVYIENIRIGNTTFLDTKFGGKAAITNGILRNTPEDAIIKGAYVKEAIVQRVLIHRNVRVFQGCIFKNAIINKIFIDGVLAIEHAVIEELNIDTVVLATEWPPVVADSSFNSPPESDEH